MGYREDPFEDPDPRVTALAEMLYESIRANAPSTVPWGWVKVARTLVARDDFKALAGELAGVSA